MNSLSIQVYYLQSKYGKIYIALWQNFREEEKPMAKIKHIPTNEVHVLKGDGKTTACGFDITEKPECWEHVGEGSKITCDKNGCK